MNERDDELDKLLKPLLAAQPTGAQIKKWQSMAPRKVIRRDTLRDRLLQLTAAAIIGFILGALVFKNREDSQMLADNFDPSATIEVVYSKGY